MNNRLKALRKNLNLTQQEFANRLGVKRNTVATYEVGKSNPSDAAISLICAKFNVNEEWLRNGIGDMFIELDVEDQLMEWAGKILRNQDSDFKKRFVTMLMNLSENEWELIEKKAKELILDNKKG